MTNSETQKIKPKQSFEIPVKELFSHFADHLQIENNHRIFFSGKFGIGKTYFLNEFFKNYREEYELFHLFPVYYQIGSDEDITELLKYDLLVELLRKNKDLFKKSENGSARKRMLLLYARLRENFSFPKTLGNMTSAASVVATLYDPALAPLMQLGRPLGDAVNFIDDFRELKSELGSREHEITERYLKEFKKSTETDYFSEFLKNKIAKQAIGKKSILLLDDLDRIDPEHIFRILNIFSTHFDLETNKSIPNKFGFDRVILVGDRQNIENIFYHKYGKATNFNGYFDKFFNYGVYYFDNEEVVSGYVDGLIAGMNVEDQSLMEAMGESGYIKIFLSGILKEWLRLEDSRKLNLRQLLKFRKFDEQLIREGDYRYDQFSEKSENFLKFLDFSIKILSIIAVDSGSLVEVLLKIKENDRINKEDLDRHYLFSKFLFERITGNGFKDAEEVREWNGYELKLKGGGFSENIELVNTSLSRTPRKLFYDLLVEYIRRNLYNKKNTQW